MKLVNAKYKQSKFIFDADKMQVVSGSTPRGFGSLLKGETTTGKKMELAGVKFEHPKNCYTYDAPPFVCYWGWSNDT